VIYLGSISVGNATLVVASVLTCNNHSQYGMGCVCVWCGVRGGGWQVRGLCVCAGGVLLCEFAAEHGLHIQLFKPVGVAEGFTSLVFRLAMCRGFLDEA
jgi:hypothetical protein